MIRVHVWLPHATSPMGHASMHVGPTYISWWPGSSRKYYVSRKLPLYSAPHVRDQSAEADACLEADGEWDPSRRTCTNPSTGMPVAPRVPITIPLHGLDEKRILEWWLRYNVPGREWTTLGQNCSTTVGRALMIGGGDDYALGASGWYHSWNTVWTPRDVLRYATAIGQGLTTKGSRQAAINLIRRFCTSPLGFTSLTWSIDEEGLSLTLYEEVGADTARLRLVFEELQENRHSDADDVAESYVNLLMTRGGAPREAVTRDNDLRQLLIKVMEEGWTSAGERKCIDFVKSLK